jgi:hypothetical protein
LVVFELGATLGNVQENGAWECMENARKRV